MSVEPPVKISPQSYQGSKRYHSLMKTAQNRDVLLSFSIMLCSDDYNLYLTTPIKDPINLNQDT